MTWRSFVDYWLMKEMGTDDAIARNYSLWGPRAFDNNAYVLAAVKRIGDVDMPSRADWRFAVEAIASRLRSTGADASFNKVVRRLNEYWLWDRARCGELRRLPLKPPGPAEPNPLLD